MTLGDRISSRQNNLDFIRFLAAAAVIFSHSYPLSGAAPEPWLWLTQHQHLGYYAVSVFFVISGLLIARSWCERPQLGEYLKKRALRIFPAMIASGALCALVIGPLATTWSFQAYFTSEHPWKYVYRSATLFFPPWFLPGVFESNPHSASVNGSLWTLPVEGLMYLCVPAAFWIGWIVRRYRRAMLWLLLSALLLFQWHYLEKRSLQQWVIGSFPVHASTFCIVHFVIGAIMYAYRESIRLSFPLFVIAALLFFVSFRTPHCGSAGYLTLPYMTIYLGFARYRITEAFSRWGDPSYGLYVYAFPIQQTCVAFLPEIGPLTLFFISFWMTLGVAYLSWHGLEKPALRWARSRRPAAEFSQLVPALQPAKAAA